MYNRTKSKSRSFIFSAICVLLAVVMGAGAALYTFGEASDVNYLCDLKLFYEENEDGAAEKARAKCESMGYKFLNADLNQGTTKKFVFLGYKTTKNKNDAITDIRMLGMDTDYQLYNYKQIIEYLKKQQAGTAFNMNVAATEFIDAYKAGSEKAADAYEALNLFRVDEDTLLGDYILEENADEDFFMEMLAKASNGTTNAVITFLNAGVAPFENDYDDETDEAVTKDWAESIQDSSLWLMFDEGLTTDEKKELKKQFGDDAKLLFRQMQSFTSSYYTAAERSGTRAKNIEAPDEIKSDEDGVEYSEKIEEEDTDAIFIATYEKLNNYNYNSKKKLGDWILETGLMSSEEVDLQTIYPVLDSMSEGQIGIAETNGIVSAVANLGENEHIEKMDNMLEKAKSVISDFNSDEAVSLWEKGDLDIEQSYIAYTTEAIRNQQAANVLDDTGNSLLEFEEKFDLVMKWISAISGLLTVAGFITNKILMGVSGYYAATGAVTTIAGYMSTVLTVVGVYTAFMFWVGVVVMLVNVITSIVIWFMKMFDDKVDPEDQSIMPAYVFDSPVYSSEVMTVKYKSVRNSDNDIGDLNAREQVKWDILCYTKDTRVGSPIMEDSDGNIFKVVHGDGSKQNGYDCVNYFGQRSPGDANKFCKKNEVDGIYISYRTEKSIKSEAPEGEESNPETEESTQFISALWLQTASSRDKAHAKINQKEKKYYILDQNLSPEFKRVWSIRGETEIYTYLGYAITEDRSKAVTDIRIAPYQGTTDSIQYGEITYYYGGNSGMVVNDSKGESTPQCDALYYTTDPKAGTPIGVDKLHICTSYDEAKEGWEPVSLFGSNIPYNFNAAYQAYDEKTNVSGYFLKNTYKHGGKGISTDGNWFKIKKRYIFYEPEKKYTSGQKYVSGIFFVGGASYVSSNWYDNCLSSNFEKLPDYLSKYGETYFERNINMAQCIKDHLDVDGRNYRVYIGYNFTYNPYRAIYDVGVFQGTTYTDNLPYNISRAKSGGGNYSFVATNYIGMQKKDYDKQSIWRYINPGNTYLNRNGCLIWDGDRYHRHGGSEMTYFDEEGYAKAESEYINFGYDEMPFLPTNLYISGYVKNKKPLKSSDIVITKNNYEATSSDGETSVIMEKEKAIDGSPAKGAFHSVCELKNPNSKKAFNLSYPGWTDDSDNELDKGSELYVYIRGAKTDKLPYIKSLSVGSFSRAQYLAQPGAKNDGDTLGVVDTLVDINAMAGALGGCTDEVIMTNVAIPSGDAWYNRKKDDDDHPNRATWDAPSDKPAAYIGVSRTYKASEAITGAMLLVYDGDTAPAEKTIKRVKYYCAGMNSPIKMNGKNYFLYYTYNPGVNAGLPIEEISVDEMPLKRGSATALTYDARESSESDKLIGDPNQTNYVHLSYNHSSNNIFYNKLYIGKGDSKKAALCNLIEQECVEFLDLDMNADAKGDCLYLGMRVESLDTEMIDSIKTSYGKKKEREEQWFEAICDIIVTNDEPYQKDGFVADNNVFYYPVSDINLNEGTTGNELYMYVSSDFYSGRYNYDNNAETAMPFDVFGTPYTALAMARYDRVPYNTDVKSTGGDTVIKWEHIMQANSNLPIDLNFGAVKFVDDEYYVCDNRVSMFGQRYDGGVKDGAEITGGFIADSANKGKMFIENQE